MPIFNWERLSLGFLWTWQS